MFCALTILKYVAVPVPSLILYPNIYFCTYWPCYLESPPEPFVLQDSIQVSSPLCRLPSTVNPGLGIIFQAPVLPLYAFLTALSTLLCNPRALSHLLDEKLLRGRDCLFHLCTCSLHTTIKVGYRRCPREG